MVAARSGENYTSIDEDEDSMELVIVHPENDTELFEQERMIEPINHFFSGDVRAVQKYLETSSDARLFVQGRYPDGKTNLIVAAIYQSSAMVAPLIEHGAQINAVDNSGRTALMEAALFDRADNVKVLVQTKRFVTTKTVQPLILLKTITKNDGREMLVHIYIISMTHLK